MLADRIGFAQLRELAAHKRRFNEQLSSEHLQRATEMTHARAESAAALAADMKVMQGAYGFPELACNVSGSLKLECQRCLEPLDWPLQLDFRLVVVESEGDLDDVSSRFDAIVIGEHGIRLAEVIEDEILSSLPLAPMHEVGPNCNAESNGINAAGAGSEEDKSAEHGDMQRPFANLADLVRGNEQSGTSGKK